MLSALRKRKNNPIIVGLLLLIVVVFIAFFGPSLKSCGSDRLYAARVNGSVIPDEEFSNLYASAFRSHQAREPTFDRTKAQQMNLRKQVLDQMITTSILAQDAGARGLAIDDEALRQAILSNEAFQTDGKFDRKLYERILNNQQLPDFRFEAQLREGLLAGKIASLVENAVSVSQGEAKEAFFREKRKINLEIIQVKKQGFEGKVGTVTQADADAWVQKPGSDELIQKHYTRFSRTRYNVPKQIRAQHILVRVDKTTPPDIRHEAQRKIEEAAAKVRGGMDFAEAAKKYSDDSTRDKGGDLGLFSEGQMVPQFEQAAFALKVGEISNLVETPFGYHIIKVNEIKEPVLRKLEDVRSEIALELYRGAKAGELASAIAQDLSSKARAGKSFAEIVAQANKAHTTAETLGVDETGPFQAGKDFVPKVGLAKGLSKAAWKLTQEAPLPDGPMETENAWIVFRLKEKTEPTDAEFDAERENFMLRLTFQKKQAAVEAWMKQLRDAADLEIHPLALSYDDDARAAARQPSP